MSRPHPLSSAERALLRVNGWREDRDQLPMPDGRMVTTETGYWFPPDPYVGPGLTGKEALRKVRARLHGGKR